ncbi:GA module-containing protein [Mycoplasmopsis verecunda]|uniref:Protein G-related albumin-binding (GA) module domain-containing protein n=1 Tax=Mycoplasmopsis verecunda TaxID=171291 RepID=A0A1T4KGU4_9BACT|nr:GA module-containing protein [Mycoplasmopsis verecunda]WPB54237.1 GA module-containing protein [Mycoplasmopsis verecunda]SJZ41577.1 hypothetical protein SAMN02745154_00057 [Mycoplasmopsis verecunda]
MSKKIKWILLPVASGSLLTLPLIGLISQNPDTDVNYDSYNVKPVNFGNSKTDYIGSYITNQVINIVKNGQNQPSSAIYGNLYPLMPSINVEWNNVASSYDIWQNGYGWRSTSATDGNKLVNPYYGGVVYLEETTPRDSNTSAYDISTAKVRSWRATFNNNFVPANPGNTAFPEAGGNGWTPDGYGNLSFGIMLTRNMQLVDNSVRITVLARDNNGNQTGVPGQGTMQGYITYLLNKKGDFPAITGNVTVPPKNVNSSLGSTIMDLDYLIPQVLYIGNQGYEQNWNQVIINGGWAKNGNYNQPFLLNNVKYQTVDPTWNNYTNMFKLYQGNRNQSGDPLDPYWQELNTQFLNQVPGSPYDNNTDNIGSVFMGQVSTGSWWYRDTKYRPAVVLEFQTVDNQSTINVDNNGNKYMYTNGQSNGGITAVTSFYRGLYLLSGWQNSGTFVATHSLSYNRSKYRTINIQIKEQAINGWFGIKNKQENYFLPNNAYGYDLIYRDSKGVETTIASIPSDVIGQGKSQTYEKGVKEFTINLSFNSDVTLWPEEMKQSHGSFINPNKLILRKAWNNPKVARFFAESVYTQQGVHDWDGYTPDDPTLGEYQLGTTYLNPASLNQEQQIQFVSTLQWYASNTDHTGYNKLYLLNKTQQSTSENGNSKSTLSYYKTYNYKNVTFLPKQKEAFQKGVYDDWDPSHFFNPQTWWNQYNDLKQANYNATQASSNALNLSKIVKYNENPTGTSDTINSVREFLNYNNYETTNQTNKDTLSNYINYSFAPSSLKEAYVNDFTNLMNWQNVSTPNYDISNPSNVTDTNQSAEKIQNIINQFNTTVQLLTTKTDNGFDNKQQTSQEFIQNAFNLIDATSIYSNAYKETFKTIVLQQVSRTDVINYVNAIVSLDKKYAPAKTIYDEYQPVLKNPTYKNVQVTNRADKTFNNFSNVMNTINGILTTVASYASQGNINNELTNIAKIESLNNSLVAQNIVDAYAKITTDITGAISTINTMLNLNSAAKNGYIQELWNIVKVTAPTNYTLLNNYIPRETQVALVVGKAQFNDYLNQQSKIGVLAQNYANFTQTNYINSIDKVTTNSTITVDNAKIASSNDYHSNIPFVMQGENKVFIFPNVTLDSASVNYAWQSDAKAFETSNTTYPSAKYQMLTNANTTYSIPPLLVQGFNTQLEQSKFANASAVNEFVTNWKNYVTRLVTILTNFKEDLNNIEEPNYSNLNQAQFEYYVSKYVSAFTQSTNASEVQSAINTIAAEVIVLKIAMQKLNSVLDTYVSLTSNTNTSNVFSNGQFYGISNLDPYITLSNDVYNFNMPKANGEFIALISTAYQLLQKVPNGINKLAASSASERDKYSAKSKNNLPYVLSLTTLSQATPYTWYSYSTEQVKDLANAITSAAIELQGRYEAVNQYPAYVLNKYFSDINAQNVSLYSAKQIQDVLSALNLNAEDFSWANNADKQYYTEINNKLIIKAVETYLTSSALNNLSQDEINNAKTQLATGADTIDFDTMRAFNLTQPQWIWKVQAILYQLGQIQDKKGQLNTSITSAQALTQNQKQALLAQVKNANMYSEQSTNITLLKNALPASFEETTKILYNDTLVQFPETLAKVIADTQALNTLYNKVTTTLGIGTSNISPMLQYATNKETFMQAYNAIGNLSDFSIIDPSEIEKLTNNLQTQYDALNGYLNYLQEQINQINPLIKTFNPDSYENDVNISTIKSIPDATAYQNAYNSVLDKLITSTNSNINKLQYLNQAQKNALNQEVSALTNTAQFNDIVPLITKAQELNTSMQALQEAYNNAQALVANNQTAYDELPDTEGSNKDKFAKALAQAQVVFGKYSEQEANNQNIDKVTADNLTQELKDLQLLLNKDITVQKIKDLLKDVNSNSSQHIQNYKEQIESQIADPNSLSQDQLNKILQQTKNVVAIEPLSKILEQAATVSPKSDNLQNIIKQAAEAARNWYNSDNAPSSTDVNNEVTKVQNALKLNELQNDITSAKNIARPSKVLQDAISNGETVANNQESAKYQDAINKLNDAILKEPLNKAIEIGNKVNQTANNPELTNAIKQAQETLSQNNLTPEQVNDAANSLTNIIKQVAGLQIAKDELKDLIDDANKQNGNNNGFLKDMINSATSALNDPKASVESINSATNQLTYTISLDKLIQAVNTSQTKVEEQNRTTQLIETLKTTNAFISQWEPLIKANTNLNSETQLDQFNQDVSSNLSNVFTNTNANDLVNLSNKTLAQYPSTDIESLVPYHTFFQNTANALAQKINSVVPNDSFTFSDDKKADAELLGKQIVANGYYYDINKVLNDFNQPNIDLSPKAQVAISDAKVLVKAFGISTNFGNQQLIINSIDSIASQFSEEIQKLKDQPYELIDQIAKNLQIAYVQNNLINTITQGQKLAQVLSTPNNVDSQYQTVKQAIDNVANPLNEAIKNAQDKIATNSSNTADYQDVQQALDNAIASAHATEKTYLDTLNNTIASAESISPASEQLNTALSQAKTLVSSQNPNAFDMNKTAEELNHLGAKDKLQNLINSLDSSIKNVPLFATGPLKTASDTLNNTQASTQDLTNVYNQLQEAIKKEKLYIAYNDSLSAAQPLSQQASETQKQALGMLNDTENQYVDKDQSFFDNEADTLNRWVSTSNLQNAINKANAIPEANRSQALSQELSIANELNKEAYNNLPSLNNSTANTLNELTNKNPLYVAIENIKQWITKFTPDQESDAIRQTPAYKTLQSMQQALQTANTVYQQTNPSEQDVQQQVQALEAQIKAASDMMTQANEALNKAITSASEIPSDNLSNYTNTYLNNAKTVVENTNSTIYHVQDATKQLTFAAKANALDNAVAKAPAVSEIPNVEGFDITTTASSQQMLQEQIASEEEINTQTNNQLVFNAKANGLINIAKMQNLNNAQKLALDNQILQAQNTEEPSQTINSVNEIVQKATELNNAMGTLQNTVNNIPAGYKVTPIKQLNYVYSTKDKQEAFVNAFNNANDVLNKGSGQVIDNNNPQAIIDMSNTLQQAYDNLDGVKNAQGIIVGINNKLNESVAQINSNSLFNAPSSMQQSYNEAKEALQQEITNASNNLSSIDTDKINQLNNDLTKLNNQISEINKFSDKEFELNDKQVPQIQVIANELDNVSDKYQQQVISNYNASDSYDASQQVIVQANDLNNQIGQTLSDVINSVSQALNSLNNTTTNINTAIKNTNKLAKLQNANATKVQEVANANVALENISNLINALDKYQKTSTKSTSYDSTLSSLKQAIANAKTIEVPTSASEQLQQVIQNENSLIQQLTNKAVNTIDVVNALQKDNQTAFNTAINSLAKGNSIYNDFKNVLDQNNYFNIVNKKEISSQEAKQLNNVITSSAYNNMPEVIKSTIVQKIRSAKDAMPWWSWIIISASLIFMAGITLLAFTRKTKY